MTYTKPEAKALGDAVRVIQTHPKPLGANLDPIPPASRKVDPAYDLDE